MTDAAPLLHDLPQRRSRLLRWYARHKRDLPWRPDPPSRPANPYYVLVSETMLQQTQVATVIDYFNRFVERWPNVAALAAVDEQAVLRAWQGLGYYRRARHLHAAAKAVVERHGGELPRDVDALQALPGVGRYTAGAIASIAFNRKAPLVDGNVARVLSRWTAMSEPIDDPDGQRRLWSLAEQLADHRRPGDVNQALMELGALVCTPRAPACLTCPVREGCAAGEAGEPETYPKKRPKRQPTAVEHHIVALSRPSDAAREFLFVRRPDRGLWSSMWQLPTAESLDLAHDAADDDAAPVLVAWLRDAHGVDSLSLALPSSPVREIAAFAHRTTHRTIAFRLWLIDAGARAWASSPPAGERAEAPPAQWRTLDAIDDLPLPNPQRRAVALLADLLQAADDS